MKKYPDASYDSIIKYVLTFAPKLLTESDDGYWKYPDDDEYNKDEDGNLVR